MADQQCLCGFSELADEQLIDHLNAMFVPPDGTANDGQIHEEGKAGTCTCGLAAATVEELDQHFLTVFTPDDGIGADGQRHGEAGAADG